VQSGDAQKLVKVSPLVLIASKLGVFGLILPSVYPLMASLPKSSAIINKILGDTFSVESFVFSLLSEEQPKVKRRMNVV
jgi:hypothetical protein